MPIVRLNIPVYLPMALYRPLRRLKRAISDRNRPTRNLWGDRDVEYSFIAAHMPKGPGKALDFGSGSSYMSLLAALRGFEVIALDLEPQTFPWRHPAVRFIQGDLLELDLPTNHFDLIINCSTVEHVGLVGRYSVTESRPDGDLEAMALLRDLMKPSAIMLLTVPVGQDAVFAPLCRVYGKERLPRLLSGFVLEREMFWVKDAENRWVQCDEETALSFEASAGSWDPLRNVYALGCFVLRKPDQ
jgi:SAM-dependent methyltransferase